MLGRVSVLLALAGVLLPPASAGALTLDPVDTFNSPVFVTSDPADADRLFVVERGGKIRLKEGAAAPTTFLDLTALDSPPTTTGERGLLSMAFAADYSDSGRFYVFYTHGGTVGSPVVLGDLGDLQVDEFTASGDSVDIETRRPLLTIEHSSQANHNGGQLQVGPDGYLYIGTGDGGSGGDPDGNAQNLNSLLGKLLRIDPSEGAPYAIPPDNPFVGPIPGADEIWSYGLRNPWRFSFDRLTKDLLIGDVGQGRWEEIDYEPDDPDQALSNAGRADNFGWDCREGPDAYGVPPDPGSPSPLCAGLTDFTEPVYEYPHSIGCSITGGYVARDASLGDLFGRYVFIDLCAGTIGSVIPGLPMATEPRPEGLSVQPAASFGEDACGRLYIARFNPLGVVWRFTGDEPAECELPPRTLTVSVDGTGAGTVSGPGISCPGDCTEDYDAGTEVTLTQAPTGDSTFAGWSGDCTGTGPCQLTMDADLGVTATFNGPSPQHTLDVEIDGTGAGTVTGDGISCPGDCTQDYDEGTVVTLSQSPIGDSIFAGWGSACSGAGPCQVTMSVDRTVTSTFDTTPEPPPVGTAPSCGGDEATIEAEPGEATVATPGVDIIVGTPGPDVIRGLGGNDRICGLAGRDALSGAAGADALKGGDGRDRLRGGAGPDRLNGGPQRDRCAGGPGRDTERSC